MGGKVPPRLAAAFEWGVKNRAALYEDDLRRLATPAGRRQAIDNYKMAQGCADCGLVTERPEVLEFDHVRGEKLFAISAGLHHKPAILWAEIEKCEVVCANCHRVRTVQRRRETIAAGAPWRTAPIAGRVYTESIDAQMTLGYELTSED
jgi:hypothetical protein